MDPCTAAAAMHTASPYEPTASGDTGRSKLTMGDAISDKNLNRPSMKPNGIPIKAAMKLLGRGTGELLYG